jgi:energy-coupling factor transporter transmembrane protein EcfT
VTALDSGAAPTSSLARRNPTVKLALLTVVSVVALFVLDPVTPLVLWLVALVGVTLATRAPARTIWCAHVPFVAFATGVLLVNLLSRPGPAVWEAGPLRVTQAGVDLGLALAGRTLLIGVLSIGFLLSTDGVALMTSLHHNARVSPRVTYAMLAGYRMLQEMPREWSTLQHAHAVRAPRREGVHPVQAVRHHAGVVFALLVLSVRKGERLSQALESRGLGLEPRTTWRPVTVDRHDWAMVAGVLAGLAGTLAASAAVGVLRGPAALLG